MKIHHLRNATFVIESGTKYILIDPMLSEKGELPPFARFRHKAERNPTVPLPDNASQILGQVTHCLITHCQAFGLKALQHTDHLEALNHCPTTRPQLRQALEDSDLLSKTHIPEDGETLTIDVD